MIREIGTETAWFAAAENGDVYELTISDGILTNVLPGIWAKASIVALDTWEANPPNGNDVLTWRVDSAVVGSPLLQSPSGHDARFLLVNEANIEHKLFIDDFGFAEEVFADTSGIYRTFNDNATISPPPAPTQIILNGLSFDAATSAVFDQHPQLPSLDHSLVIRSYAGSNSSATVAANETVTTWAVSTEPLPVANSFVELPVVVETVQERQRSDDQVVDTTTHYLARASDNHIYRLTVTDDEITGVDGGDNAGIVAYADPQQGDSWTDVGVTLEVTSVGMNTATLYGHQASLVLANVADAQDQVFYDDTGFAQRHDGTNALGSYRFDDQILPPTVTVNGGAISTAGSAAIDDSPQIGDLMQYTQLSGD